MAGQFPPAYFDTFRRRTISRAGTDQSYITIQKVRCQRAQIWYDGAICMTH